jgi:signal transduction histidine kinase
MIARDLHDEIGSTLTSINILSKVSQRNLSKDDARAAELLDKVIDQSQQIQQNMSDIVWAIKPDNDRIGNMTVRMREYLSHTLEPKDILIEFRADDPAMQTSLSMQGRRDFFLIFKEAVNNIAKYSRCKHAEILLSRHNGHISLVIRDDGVGFDVLTKRSANGLKNMIQRAELMKGSLQITSSPGQGTEIRLSVPAT